MKRDIADMLRAHGISATAQRVAVAAYILDTEDHPSAEQVFDRVKRRVPVISRATVYNTLNLLADKGVIRRLHLAEGRVVFDPKRDHHHHFIDEGSGRIYDIPWAALEVSAAAPLEGYDVHEYQVVMRGRKTSKS